MKAHCTTLIPFLAVLAAAPLRAQDTLQTAAPMIPERWDVTVEHNVPPAPLYGDVLRLWSESDVGYTPTLIVNFGGLNGEYWFYQHDEVWKNERLRRFTPARVLDPRSRRRIMAADEDYSYIEVSRAAKALLDADRA